MEREPRFPGAEWYCYKCNRRLDLQDGFDDHKYTWKCTHCGFRNSISRDNLPAKNGAFVAVLGRMLNFISGLMFWGMIVTFICIFAADVSFSEIADGAFDFVFFQDYFYTYLS